MCYYLQQRSAESAGKNKKNDPSQECCDVVSGHIERQSKQTKDDGKYVKTAYGKAALTRREPENTGALFPYLFQFRQNECFSCSVNPCSRALTVEAFGEDGRSEIG
jgi:hypothetical protein